MLLRGHCEGDLGGTENLSKPSENLGRSLEKLLLIGELWGGIIHGWVESTFLNYI